MNNNGVLRLNTVGLNTTRIGGGTADTDVAGLYDSEGYALYDSEGYRLDCID